MKFRREILLFGFTAGCLIPASWMTLHREAGYDVVNRSYQDLQAMSDRLHISSLDIESAKLRLTMSGSEPSRWLLSGESPAGPESSQEHGVLRVPVRAGIHRYEARSDRGDRVAISTIAGGDVPDPLVSNASVPLARSLPFETADFVIAKSALDPREVAEAQAILSEIGVDDAHSDRDKVIAIASYLHGTLYPHRGQPTPRMRRLSGFGQFQEALAGRSGVYCANHAEIFAFFAVVAGVPTRLVDVGRTFDGLPVAAHAFAESLLPEEGGWAYVDLQLNIALITDRQGRVQNGLDVLHRSLADNWDGLKATVLVSDGSDEAPQAVAFDLVQSFVPPESTLTYLWGSVDRYSLVQRLSRLFLVPQPAYSLARNSVDARGRLVLTYLGLGGGLAVFGSLLARWIRWRRSN